QIKLQPQELAEKAPDEIKSLLHGKVMELYHQKEIEFPVKVAMARFMAERQQVHAGGQRYDREGLYHWTRARFPGVSDYLSEENFRTQSRVRLQEQVLETSREYFPREGEDQIDAKLAEAFQGTNLSEPDDARELAEWAREHFQLENPEAALTGVS